MLEIILELWKYIGAMLVASCGLNLILRPKVNIKISAKEIVSLPISVLIEEAIFRLGAFWVIGLLTQDLRALIGISTTAFALVHISNLNDKNHKSAIDAIKYLINIGTLGIILGLAYYQYGFVFVCAAHLIYDFLALGAYMLQKKLYGVKDYGKHT